MYMYGMFQIKAQTIPFIIVRVERIKMICNRCCIKFDSLSGIPLSLPQMI